MVEAVFPNWQSSKYIFSHCQLKSAGFILILQHGNSGLAWICLCLSWFWLILAVITEQ